MQWRNRDSDTRGENQVLTRDVTGLLQRLEELLRNQCGIPKRGNAWEKRDKLIPAEARDNVFGTQRLLEASGYDLQDLIADIVAEGIVDRLKPVQVDEQQCERAVISCGQRFAKLIFKVAAVVQLGQWITVNLTTDRSFCDAVLGDIPCGCIEFTAILPDGGAPLEVTELTAC
jgi:hypothetical protein